MTTEPAAAVAAVFRIEFPKLAAHAARILGDLEGAEECAQDAFVQALETWPTSGTPANPPGWLMTVCHRRAVDRVRRRRTLESRYPKLAEPPAQEDPLGWVDDRVDDAIEDDRLRLIFVACSPVLGPDARAALTLRMVGGLTTAEIARAYLQPEPTVAQRIVRAKRRIAGAGVAFEVPPEPERQERLRSVLEVIYLIFNEGYTATAGAEWFRIDLCAEALRLSRTLAALMPDEAEAHGLQALLEIQSSRLGARRGPAGEPILLLEQDRGRWDQLLIRRGLAALAEADRRRPHRGVYALQAAIAACHARAFRPEDTDWAEIVSLYGALQAQAPSPVVELNRAVAVSMADGPQAGLVVVDTLRASGALEDYHLFHSVRGDLLERLARTDEAASEFELAADLSRNERERSLLRDRAARNRATTVPGAPPESRI